MLGGRLNTNLREEKHWSYGASTRLLFSHGQWLFFVDVPVQGDKTAGSIGEIIGEFNRLRSNTISAEQLASLRRSLGLHVSAASDTLESTSDALAEIVRLDLPLDYFRRFSQQASVFSGEDLQQAARARLNPDHLVWLIVGDRKVIEPQLRMLHIGEVKVLSSDSAR
jgi:zinc protease